MNRALIVVDVQRDFCAGGVLPAADTGSLLTSLSTFIDRARHDDLAIAFTQDWHPQNHASFAAQGGPWPVHCVAGSVGAALATPLQPLPNDLMIRKGTTFEGMGYSAFEVAPLSESLRREGIKEVGICGIATEYCVKATALDALRSGFQTSVLSDLIRPVRPGDGEIALTEMSQQGIEIVSAQEWLQSERARRHAMRG